ncbi:hypothetical protein DAI22_04g244050 [Oryza sativa Japonica Group]|nr:hypothetical protein DAI22_04g244050 [Oryza sativa Japonica Group]
MSDLHMVSLRRNWSGGPLDHGGLRFSFISSSINKRSAGRLSSITVISGPCCNGRDQLKQNTLPSSSTGNLIGLY